MLARFAVESEGEQSRVRSGAWACGWPLGGGGEGREVRELRERQARSRLALR